jgi:hypothetical protein
MTKVKTLSVLIAGLVLAASVSLAQETSPSATSSVPVTKPHPLPMVVEIGPAGNALIRGTVTNVDVGTDSLTVKSWGGDWTVKIDTNTKLLPNGLTLNQIKAGDFVGLNGKVNSEETLTVHATLIRDWTEKKITKEEVKETKKEVKQILKETKPKIHVLTVETIDKTNNTLTAKLNGQTITVKLANGAKLIDRNFKTITFDKIEANDKIRVYGVLSGNTLEASVIRDISIPK